MPKPPLTPPPESRDSNWKRIPAPMRGYAALAADGSLIVNSVRATRDAVRLAAGECIPVPVQIVYSPEASE